MVVVGAAAEFVARGLAGQVHGLHFARFHQLLDVAVHRGQPDGRHLALRCAEDLGRKQGASSLFHDRAYRAALTGRAFHRPEQALHDGLSVSSHGDSVIYYNNLDAINQCSRALTAEIYTVFTCGSRKHGDAVCAMDLCPKEKKFHLTDTDRKSTRLNSSHTVISYAVFCLKKKKNSRARRCEEKPGVRGQSNRLEERRCSWLRVPKA